MLMAYGFFADFTSKPNLVIKFENSIIAQTSNSGGLLQQMK